MAESGEERRERESERVSDREWRGMCESERERGVRLGLFLKKPY